MRILLLTHNYEPELGAPQQRWGAFVRRFRERGHHVTVVTPPPHQPPELLIDDSAYPRPGQVHLGRYGEVVHRAHFRPQGHALGTRIVDQVVTAADSTRLSLVRLRKHRPDVVVATAPAIPTLGSGAVVAAALRAPLVTEMRDAWPDLLAVADEWDEDAVPPGRARALVHSRLIKAASIGMSTIQRRSAAVITTTDTFAEALRDRGLREVHVIRNGAHPVPRYPRHLPRVPDGELHVLYLGTVGRAQGLGAAVLAARQAFAAGVPIRLRIVGAGAEYDAVAEMAAKGDVPIEMVGQVPRSQVAVHYAWADTLLVHLRQWPALSVTVPSKLYEAMSLGLHITGVVDGEAAQIVRETRAGSTLTPGDPHALAELWDKLATDPSGLVVGDEGRRWTQVHADDDSLATRYLAVLERIASRRG
ncbi:glycosyltransferase family 4 protein [Intrasporangium sp. DVR]|uniref:glycosyltransferase family 4 protein n=1 Tax=Intrasporangium sp. DVR TaxID=3127867 RepID=UPI00313A661C